ncbi:DUF6465 family protein [Clostridium estertheticum]|uniref:DUF6465 family protein n=1 Tax=Clostridium estertheticum TaxID=238834 RepID=UPI0013E9946E|nr:DUF6465 family protein [Clostridium estertheticum]MBZ9688636.1 DUF6465 family protein [Clostridium estertheticum]
MEKNNTLISDKQAMSSTEEAAITKEDVEKTINALKDIVKNVKSKATRAATTASAATKKTVSKKTDGGFYVQYQGKEFSNQLIQEKVYDVWLKSHKKSEIKTLDIYLKVEDDTAYCLINGEINIDVKLS